MAGVAHNGGYLIGTGFWFAVAHVVVGGEDGDHARQTAGDGMGREDDVDICLVGNLAVGSSRINEVHVVVKGGFGNEDGGAGIAEEIAEGSFVYGVGNEDEFAVEGIGWGNGGIVYDDDGKAEDDELIVNGRIYAIHSPRSHYHQCLT